MWREKVNKRRVKCVYLRVCVLSKECRLLLLFEEERKKMVVVVTLSLSPCSVCVGVEEKKTIYIYVYWKR